MRSILEIIRRHKAGQPVGIYSVCSAHPLVIEAALRRAGKDGTVALVEATSNQVNQDGGYTGMLPADFRELVYRLADAAGFPRAKVVLGGDHLGPNCWQALPAEEAMRKSEILVSQYVRAGFRKIHLDCSMSCKGDPVPLGNLEVAARAARLCAVAEQSWQDTGGEPPVYIVGTEVPVPGGATEELEELQVTSAGAATETIRVHREAFAALGVGPAWDRVIGLVVQPGVEFGHDHVVDYRPDKARSLSRAIEDYPQMVFEAHSTDYQVPSNLQSLVSDHFAILKVGPALTYALREAYWALDQIEEEWVGEDRAVQLRKTVLSAMQQEPKYWANYYTSRGTRLALDMQYSLSDRIRYYWTMAGVDDAADRLQKSLLASPPPLTLIMQHLPAQYSAIRREEIGNNPKELVMHKIDEVLLQYSNACAQGTGEGS